jgi:1-acyl-sn-glycerol-3-phosphate acyltransferase
MSVLSVVSPTLKSLFEWVGNAEVVNRPDVLELAGAGAVIACNHVGWADSLWIAYAVYPRQLRYMSKAELFSSPLATWVLHHGGSIPINRAEPSAASIKHAISILQRGEVLLIFPTGTRSGDNDRFRRGAATIALHAGVPLLPAFYDGPKNMQFGHIMHRPNVRITFGAPIPTVSLVPGKRTALALTHKLQTAITDLRPATLAVGALL